MVTSFQLTSLYTMPLRGFGVLGRCAGVTLIELVTVLVILGVIAATMAPRFFTRDTFNERGFHDETVAAARYAQKLATASGCEVQLSIDAAGYVLNQRATDCTTGGFTRNVAHPGTGQASFTGAPPTGVVSSMTNNPAVFSAQGFATDGTTRTVTVGALSFTIVGPTGFVDVP